MKSTSGPLRAFGAMMALASALSCVGADAQMTAPGPRSGEPIPVGVSRHNRVTDSGVRRVQAGPDDVQAPRPPAPMIPAPVGPTDPIAPGVAPSAPVDSSAPPIGEGNATDLSAPRASSNAGGGSPTGAEAAQEAAAEKPEPTLLMKALGMEDSKLKIYGWIQNSYTGNANGVPRNGQNFGVTPNFKANQWMGNQYYLIFEKPLEQNDEVNFGFRVDNLFGNDWSFNHSRGFGDTLNVNGRFAGYDTAQFYAEVHLPILTEGGLDIKGGRFYTLCGYEQVPAISRPLLSVPYLFNFGQPFTHFGFMSNLHLTDKINISAGAVNGWDRFINQRYRYNFHGGFTWTFNEDKTTLAFMTVIGPNQFPNFIPPGQNIQPTGTPVTPTRFAGVRNDSYGRDDRFLFTTVLTHKWNDKLTQVFEADQAFEENVAFVGARQNGGRRDIDWYGLANWYLYSFNDKLTGVLRTEVFFDPSGVRTGTTGGRFYEETLGLIYKPKSYLWIRPEIRYDQSQFLNAFSDGTRNSQLTLAVDVILLF